MVSISATSDFDGCITGLAIYKLRNDYNAELIDSNGTEYDVSDAFSYYQDYVTLGFSFDDYELADGCYTLNVYDQCIVTSDNLLTNPDFALGFTDWVKNNSPSQYAIVADQLEMTFDPFGIGDTDYITNGDFSSGAAWTINAGWTIAGGKAVHTPGNTGTMFQTLSLPAPPLPTLGFNYYIGFTVSNWTAGTISVKLGNAAGTTSYTWKGNDRFIQFYNPKASGTIDIIFTPSSNFDGEIDDVKMVKTNQCCAVSISVVHHNCANVLVSTVSANLQRASGDCCRNPDGVNNTFVVCCAWVLTGARCDGVSRCVNGWQCQSQCSSQCATNRNNATAMSFWA